MKIIVVAFNLFFLAGASLLLLLTILAGSSNHRPLNQFYWIKANTAGIPGAYDVSAWTFWGVCDFNNYSNCTMGPAYPISPVDNFGTTVGVPQKFIDNKDTFYYLSKFTFAFVFVALGFVGLAFLIEFLGACFLVIDKIVIYFIFIGLFFVSGAAAFMTANVVLARQAFNSEQMQPHVSTATMAILWTTVVVMLISMFLTCHANIYNSYKKHMDRVHSQRQYQQQPGGYVANEAQGDDSSFVRAAAPAAKDEDAASGGVRFFKIMRNNNKVSDDESI